MLHVAQKHKVMILKILCITLFLENTITSIKCVFIGIAMCMVACGQIRLLITCNKNNYCFFLSERNSLRDMYTFYLPFRTEKVTCHCKSSTKLLFETSGELWKLYINPERTNRQSVFGNNVGNILYIHVYMFFIRICYVSYRYEFN